MATELAKAYVQIVPSAEGIKGSISEVMGEEGKKAGEKGGKEAGSNFAATIKKVLIAAGVGKIIKDAISEGANYEQLVGGVETLFKDSADVVQKYAEDAYKTAGLSANQYMETVTSFSASLLQSLDGDTGKAAEAADMAIRDMSDNANKMGSSMESIQNAYQGFAKQNYTMLDNLKLGYGGTREEMVRLLEDASKISGIEYDISSLDDVYNAIHVVQEEMGITGTTAKEAASTVSGSLASMKSSWSNMLMAVASGQDVSSYVTGLVESIKNFAGNIIPMIRDILTGLLPALATVFSELAPMLVTDVLPVVMDVLKQIAQQLVTMLPVILPIVIQTVVDLIDALASSLADILPVLIPVIIQGIIDIGAALLENLPILLKAIWDAIVVIAQTLGELLAGLWNNHISPWLSDVFSGIGEWFSGIWSSIGQWFLNIVQKVVQFFTNIWQKYNETRSNILNAIGQFFSNIWSSITTWFSNIINKVVSFVTSIPQKIREGISKVTQVGLDLVKGLWNGISNATQWVLDKIKGFGKSILNGIKKIFGIGSPSKEMAYFGEMLDAGLAVGISDNTRPISNAIDDITNMTTKGFSSNLGVNSALDVNSHTSGMDELLAMVAALAEKIDNLQIWLDGETLVGGISDRMDTALGTANVRKARGLA